MNAALIDSTALSYFADLNDVMERLGARGFDVFNLATNLIPKLYVPVRIQTEFAKLGTLPVHGAVLDRIQRSRPPFTLCLHRDPFTAAFLSSEKIQGLDAGEAEAISQSDRLNVRLFITDDIACVRAIEKYRPVIRCVNTLVVLAALDLSGYFAERDVVFGAYLSLYQKPKGSSPSTLLRNAYLAAASRYSLAIDKKTLNRKSSVKRLRS
jgi:hypothetical protein